MTATTKNAPGIRGNGPEGSDHNPTHQDGAEVMSTVPQTTDQKTDAALKPDIFIQEEDDGTRILIVHISEYPEVHVYRTEHETDDGTTTRTEWTVSIPYRSQVMDREGDFESAAAASRFGLILTQAALMAKQLEEAGR